MSSQSVCNVGNVCIVPHSIVQFGQETEEWNEDAVVRTVLVNGS